MTMRKPRIYLCGPVDAFPDLGSAWRTAAAKVVEAEGCTPAWPDPTLLAVDMGSITADRARAVWAQKTAETREAAPWHMPHMDCLRQLLTCDAVLCCWSSAAGKGTRAELAFAAWVGKPVALVLDCSRVVDGVDVDFLNSFGRICFGTKHGPGFGLFESAVVDCVRSLKSTLAISVEAARPC